MTTVLVWKERLQKVYARYSRYINCVLQFVLAFSVFFAINHNLGFMKGLSSFAFSLGLSLLCAFLPVGTTALAAILLILAHLCALSVSVAIVALMVFLLMYLFYFKFAPGTILLVLVTSLAFAFKMPFVIPVAFGLLCTMLAAIPAVLGTMTYYMLHFIKLSSSSYKDGSVKDLAEEVISLVKRIFTNKEMWIMAAVLCVSLLIVHILRTKPIVNCWKIASAAGAASAVIIATVGKIRYDMGMSYFSILLGGAEAAAAGFVLEILFFAVNYTSAEYLQFEDDDYYYYVKAIPKLSVSAPKLSVKQINTRKDYPRNFRKSSKTPPKTEKRENQKTSAEETMAADTRQIRDDAKPGREITSP